MQGGHTGRTKSDKTSILTANELFSDVQLEHEAKIAETTAANEVADELHLES